MPNESGEDEARSRCLLTYKRPVCGWPCDSLTTFLACMSSLFLYSSLSTFTILHYRLLTSVSHDSRNTSISRATLSLTTLLQNVATAHQRPAHSSRRQHVAPGDYHPEPCPGSVGTGSGLSELHSTQDRKEPRIRPKARPDATQPLASGADHNRLHPPSLSPNSPTILASDGPPTRGAGTLLPPANALASNGPVPVPRQLELQLARRGQASQDWPIHRSEGMRIAHLAQDRRGDCRGG